MLGKSAFFLLVLPILASAFINPYRSFAEYSDGGDPGKPLFLTSFIKNGSLMAAWQASQVPGRMFDYYVDSYAGYLTVNEKYNSNLFFWLVLAENDRYNAPIVLWLQGGPGVSSLMGLFQENGPFEVTKSDGLKRRKYSWHENFHLIYIDNPVGTGFSFTDHDEGYARNEEDVARDLYEAVWQLQTLFPEFQQMKWFIAGESYAGKYVPALAYKIHKTQEVYDRLGIENPMPIHLEGLAIGNGFSDPINQLKYGDYLYQLGLIDNKQRKVVQQYEKKAVKCLRKNDKKGAYRAVVEMQNYFQTLTGNVNIYNYLQNADTSVDDDISMEFVQRSDVRKIIHVGNNTFHNGEEVRFYLADDVMDSVAPWISELLDHYRIVIYNGQLDILVAYPLTVNYLENLKFSAADIYKNATRSIWRVDDEVAGYVKVAGNLTEILVRNAGHMAPADQPKWLLDLMTRFTSDRSFS